MKLVNICLAISLLINIRSTGFIMETKFEKKSDNSYRLNDIAVKFCKPNESGGDEKCTEIVNKTYINSAGVDVFGDKSCLIIFGNTVHEFKSEPKGFIASITKLVRENYKPGKKCPIMINEETEKEITCDNKGEMVTSVYTTSSSVSNEQYIPLLLFMNNKNKYRICEFNMYNFLITKSNYWKKKYSNLIIILGNIGDKKFNVRCRNHGYEDNCDKIVQNDIDMKILLGANTDIEAQNRFIESIKEDIYNKCKNQKDSEISHFIDYTGLFTEYRRRLIV